MIHVGERLRVLRFKQVPNVQIVDRSVRKAALEPLQHLGIHLKSEKSEIVLAQETVDLRNCQAMFLRVEKQVTASAHAEEIG